MGKSSKRSPKRARVVRQRQRASATRLRHPGPHQVCECEHCAQLRIEHLNHQFAAEVARERPDPERLTVLFGVHPEEVPNDAHSRPRTGLGLLQCLLHALGEGLIQDEATRQRFLETLHGGENLDEPRLPGFLRHIFTGPGPLLLSLDTYTGVDLDHRDGAMLETQCHLQLIGAGGFRLTAIASDPCRPQDVANTPYRVPRCNDGKPRGSLLVHLEAAAAITTDWLEAHPALVEGIAALCLVATAFAAPRQSPTRFAPPSPWALLTQMSEIGEAGTRARRAEGQLRSAQHQIGNLQRHIEDSAAQIRTIRATLERRDAHIARLARQAVASPVPEDATSHPAGNAAQGATQEPDPRLEEQRLLVSQLIEERDLQRREIYELQQQVEALQLAARTAAGEAPDPSSTIPTPESLTDLGPWAELALGDRVVLHPRAIETAAGSNFANPGKVYSALRALAELYWPMFYDRSPGLKDRWDKRLAELGLDCKPVGAALRNSRIAVAYEVTHEGRRHVLDQHLRGSSSFDPRFGLRIYFCRDDARRRVIVGSLPTHLPNSASN